MAFTDGVDSFYMAVKTRLATINPSRLVGYMGAQDWPPPKVTFGKLYLLNLGEAPVGPQHGTIANPVTSHLAQWVWVLQGSDLAPNLRARSRGDRLRQDVAIKDELIRALYPGFAQKQSWAANSSGALVGTAHSPVEYIVWTRPQFTTKVDKASGIVYGSMSVHISDMLDQITA